MSDDATTLPQPANLPAGETPERPRRIIRLTDEQRKYVVRRLAAGDGPTNIARDMQQRFGIQIRRQAIAHYDPRREPHCARQWAEEFGAARRSIAAVQTGRATKIARIDRLVLEAIELVVDRILKGVDAEGRKMFAKRPQDITDNDRIRALVAFMRKLKATDPDGYAEVRGALLAGDEAAPSGAAAAPGEARHGE